MYEKKDVCIKVEGGQCKPYLSMEALITPVRAQIDLIVLYEFPSEGATFSPPVTAKEGYYLTRLTALQNFLPFGGNYSESSLHMELNVYVRWITDCLLQALTG